MLITLTFDNGPTPGVTDDVLDVLASRDVPATFFVVGDRLRQPAGRALAERAKAEGHRIGNHTLTHTIRLGEADADTVRHEVDAAEELLGALAEHPPLFRPYARGGTLDANMVGPIGASLLQERGYTCLLWNCLPRDWRDPDGWVDRCMEQVTAVDWPVIVLHDVPGAALPRLPELLDRLAALDPTYGHDAPESCTPLRAGRPTTSYASLCVGP